MEKWFTLIAGPNGSGKSSLYLAMPEADKKRLGERVNYDEQLLKTGNDLQAGRNCINLVRNCFNRNISFHQETTLVGFSIFNNLERAIRQGYRTCLYYICVDNETIAVNRVQQRVLNGGHDVPVNDIIRRYRNSLINLPKAMYKCDDVVVLDNTYKPRTLYIRNKRESIFTSRNLPNWFISPFEEFKGIK